MTHLTDSEARTMPSSTADTDRKRGRLVLYILAFLVALAVIYTGAWFYFARELENRVATNLAAFKERGIDAACENANASGYPLRLGLHCTRVVWADQAKNLSIATGSLNASARINDPMRIVSDIEGPATIDAPGLMPLEVVWAKLNSDVRLDKPLPRQLAVEGADLVVKERGAAAETPPLAVLKQGSLAFSTNEPEMNVALAFANLKLSDNVVFDRPLPELTGSADIQLANGFALLGKPERDLSALRGQSGVLRNVDLGLADGSGLVVSGPFSIAEDGRITGEFNITMRNAERVAQALQAVFPEEKRTISSALQAMAFMPRDASGSPTLPLSVKEGKMSIGFIRIGRLPPV
ncbi:DUF2125 domain-containing protein [Phyllobacterium sp. 0TCS1.6C]|uniref:DUF2125 domain-containing protein n=1 Tax=unclassified Phyllobacterium TaxID=2638441 RepID=UPI0022640546|nr:MULTISPECIES: DUF2125 domain-containing protein [unclassified Phyllobacterium]MCX8281548.1 DUF2125 domain-containing protein [Phyllobacterium sp. 0TCS1.6C]MCX8292856.1 DUF2125 domain-containing protein [Phyllobacterium sp. 0TCS1.6A]